MHFCLQCANMLYIRLSEEGGNSLTFYCRHCGHEDTTLGGTNSCILDTQLSAGRDDVSHHVNRYTKLDPTLPRTNKIKCPTQNCPSNTDKGADREVIYIRYDDTKMRYLYLCANCDTTWKTAEQ